MRVGTYRFNGRERCRAAVENLGAYPLVAVLTHNRQALAIGVGGDRRALRVNSEAGRTPAIADAGMNRKVQRCVPRPYPLAPGLRVLAPALMRRAIGSAQV